MKLHNSGWSSTYRCETSPPPGATSHSPWWTPSEASQPLSLSVKLHRHSQAPQWRFIQLLRIYTATAKPIGEASPQGLLPLPSSAETSHEASPRLFKGLPTFQVCRYASYDLCLAKLYIFHSTHLSLTTSVPDALDQWCNYQPVG